MPSNVKKAELEKAIALYQSLNKNTAALIAGDRHIMERTQAIKNDLAEIQANLQDLENHAKDLQATLDTYPAKLKLTEPQEEKDDPTLEKKLDELVAENAKLLIKVREEDLHLIGDYQQTLGKHLGIVIRTKELMDDILPELELTINLHQWQQHTEDFFAKGVLDLPTLLKLHRDYYDIFASPMDDKNPQTAKRHDDIEKAIETEINKLLSKTQNPEELLSLVSKMKDNILTSSKGSPTLRDNLQPLLADAFRESAKEILNQTEYGPAKLIQLIEIYEIIFTENKQKPSPLTHKIMNQVMLALVMHFKNGLADPATDQKQLKKTFFRLPKEVQTSIKTTIGDGAFSEPRKQIITQYQDNPKRARAPTPPGAPPEVVKKDPKNPKIK